MFIRVFFNKNKPEELELKTKMNFCQIQTHLTEVYGLTGWEGYEIIPQLTEKKSKVKNPTKPSILKQIKN